eukprot:2550714-Prymnesium_polylepis.1
MAKEVPSRPQHLCAAGEGGGGISVTVGLCFLINTTICSCVAPQGGGVGVFNGELECWSGIIRNCTTVEGAAREFRGTAIYAAQAAVVKAALLTLVPACEQPENAPLVYWATAADGADATLPIRGVHLELAVACDGAPAIMSQASQSLASHALSQCTDLASNPMCGAHADCANTPTGHAPGVSSVQCYCLENTVPFPSIDLGLDDLVPLSAELSPFTKGCATPRTGSRVEVSGVTVSSVVVRLSKGLAEGAHATSQLVLMMQGTDVAPARWTVAHDSA